jgi:hypothetical protein
MGGYPWDDDSLGPSLVPSPALPMPSTIPLDEKLGAAFIGVFVSAV